MRLSQPRRPYLLPKLRKPVHRPHVGYPFDQDFDRLPSRAQLSRGSFPETTMTIVNQISDSRHHRHLPPKRPSSLRRPRSQTFLSHKAVPPMAPILTRLMPETASGGMVTQPEPSHQILRRWPSHRRSRLVDNPIQMRHGLLRRTSPPLQQRGQQAL